MSDIKKMPKRVKKQSTVTEPKEDLGECLICMSKYTQIIRKKCVCNYCKADSCSKCIERYLLETIQDAHCLHCKVNYSEDMLRDICTTTYLNQTYYKHRQEILINREKANLPGLQHLAIERKRANEITKQVEEISKEIDEIQSMISILNAQYFPVYNQYYEVVEQYHKNKSDEELVKRKKLLRNKLDHFREELDDLDKKKKEKNDYINDLLNTRRIILNGGVKSDENDERKKFIRKCAREGCNGFLSHMWKCGICEYYFCNKCLAEKGPDHDSPHECKKEDLEMAELLKKDTKPCPSCGELITKGIGCDMMWCISCKTPFSWNTGRIITSGTVHNPHYFEWIQRTGGHMPRNPGDIPCGGYPDIRDMRYPIGIRFTVRDKINEFLRICIELADISQRNYRSHLDVNNTNEINIRFLLGEYDEKTWGQKLAAIEKERKRDNEIQEIFGAFRMASVELINRIFQYEGGFQNVPIVDAEKIIEDTHTEITSLIELINTALKRVSISYNMRIVNINKMDKDNSNHPMLRVHYYISTEKFTSEKKNKKAKNIIVEPQSSPTTV